MSQPRFELQAVENHGRRVAVVFDHATEKTYRIHRKGSRFLHWDRSDVRVETKGLRDCAKEALA
jgi:endo-1,4-beta-mannosidase